MVWGGVSLHLYYPKVVNQLGIWVDNLFYIPYLFHLLKLCLNLSYWVNSLPTQSVEYCDSTLKELDLICQFLTTHPLPSSCLGQLESSSVLLSCILLQSLVFMDPKTRSEAPVASVRFGGILLWLISSHSFYY